MSVKAFDTADDMLFFHLCCLEMDKALLISVKATMLISNELCKDQSLWVKVTWMVHQGAVTHMQLFLLFRPGMPCD